MTNGLVAAMAEPQSASVKVLPFTRLQLPCVCDAEAFSLAFLLSNTCRYFTAQHHGRKTPRHPLGQKHHCPSSTDVYSAPLEAPSKMPVLSNGSSLLSYRLATLTDCGCDR